MCVINQQPVNPQICPCGNCAEYLNSCLLVIINGFIWGECDFCYCEFCNFYEECISKKELLNSEITEL